MDRNEVIILSSDDESDAQEVEDPRLRAAVEPTVRKVVRILKRSESGSTPNPYNVLKRKFSVGLSSDNNVSIKYKIRKVKASEASKESPEVVDLVECSEKSPKKDDESGRDCGRKGETQSRVKLDVIDIDGGENDFPNCLPEEARKEESPGEAGKSRDSGPDDSNEGNVSERVVSDEEKKGNTEGDTEGDAGGNESATDGDSASNENSNQNLKHFTEFVEFCGSLEAIPRDRVRLTKKLMKRYGEAESGFIKSEEFRALIEKCKRKVNVNNLYLIAKEVTDELSYRKKIQVIESSKADETVGKKCESAENAENPEKNGNKPISKRTKFINKIIKKLEKMGRKIRELEEMEVDLSDEEGSSYIQLQRYREKFCQVYNKLCTYTNSLPDAEGLVSRRICFTESKYPAINKCIEVWLNKTRRFPDFMDVMKLLESQRSSLGLPSNRESLRAIATEIFQQVGVLLQRRRKYDLWDSFSGFLDDSIDPAVVDPVLEKVLKENFETRIKKEQEIFQYYTEMQERERLEPEEVPEEEANRSPTESGNEDEKEIEEIENDINERLDVTIMEETQEKDCCDKYSDSEENSRIKSETEDQKSVSTAQKESKNNFKNCKSLKWRSENSGKSKGDSAVEPENEEKEGRTSPSVDEPVGKPSESKDCCEKSKVSESSDSDLELLPVETEEVSLRKTGGSDAVKENSGGKDCTNGKKTESTPVKTREGNGKLMGPFDVLYCHVTASNAFENLSEKRETSGKRKVFRDLTNVNRWMQRHGKRRNLLELLAPSFFPRELEKSWKRRYRVSYRIVGSRDQNCALGQEGKTERSMSSDAGSEESVREESGRAGEEGGGWCRGRGDKSQEDGGEDENRKNRRTGDEEGGESKPEEEEEEEEDEEEKDESEREGKIGGGDGRAEESEVKGAEGGEGEKDVGVKREEINGGEEESVGEQDVIVEEEHTRTEQKENENKSGGLSVKVERNCEEERKVKTEPDERPGEVNNSELMNSPQRQLNQVNERVFPIKTEKEDEDCQAVYTRKQNGSGVANSVRDLRKKPRKRILGLPPNPNAARKQSTEDDERVKRFLLHSPSSISIIPPKTICLSKPPSQAALQALATLRNLKGISTTVVKKKPRGEDDVMVIGESQGGEGPRGGAKRRRSELPVISNVQSYSTPKIVTVQGNVAGFESGPQGAVKRETAKCEGSAIRISNVWGNLGNSVKEERGEGRGGEEGAPGCSGSEFEEGVGAEVSIQKKRNAKKVEYVELE